MAKKRAGVVAYRSIMKAKVDESGVVLEALHKCEGILAVALGLRKSAWTRARERATRAMTRAVNKSRKEKK